MKAKTVVSKAQTQDSNVLNPESAPANLFVTSLGIPQDILQTKVDNL